jgi:hypothetical protein
MQACPIPRRKGVIDRYRHLRHVMGPSVDDTDALHDVSSCPDAVSSVDSHATTPRPHLERAAVHPKMDNRMDELLLAGCQHPIYQAFSRPRQDSNLRRTV